MWLGWGGHVPPAPPPSVLGPAYGSLQNILSVNEIPQRQPLRLIHEIGAPVNKIIQKPQNRLFESLFFSKVTDVILVTWLKMNSFRKPFRRFAQMSTYFSQQFSTL